MNSEEILNMKMLIGHLDLTTDTKNKLYNQTTKIEDKLNKQKKVLDKIKEYLEEDDWASVNGVIAVKLIKERLNKLLEEIK